MKISHKKINESKKPIKKTKNENPHEHFKKFSRSSHINKLININN
jgi:hypothetical protein